MRSLLIAAAAFLLLNGVVVADLLAGDLAAGREKAVRCAPCHGIDGLAKQPHVPHIAGESALYLRKQLEAFRGGKREDPQMSIMAAELDDQDIADLIEWYSRIEISVVTPQ